MGDARSKIKGLVLAGGQGTRLRPLTYSTPKQLVPVANRPIIHHVLEQLETAGIREIGVIVAPETAKRVEKAVLEYPGTLSFEFIVQSKPAGLAHAVRTAREFLGDSDFTMYLGDNLIDGGVTRLVDQFVDEKLDAALLLKRVSDPSAFGVAEVDSRGNILKLVEKPMRYLSNLALVGAYCFSAKVHTAIETLKPSSRGEYEITDAIQSMLESGQKVRWTELESWWLDCGKKDDLLEANRIVLGSLVGAEIKGDVSESTTINGDVFIAPGARVESSTLTGPIIIGSGSRIVGSDLGPNTCIGSECTIEYSTISDSVLLGHNYIGHVERMSSSVIGYNARITKTRSDLSLIVGDDCIVEY